MDERKILALVELLHQENLIILQTLYQIHLPPEETKRVSAEIEESWNNTLRELEMAIMGEIDGISDSND